MLTGPIRSWYGSPCHAKTETWTKLSFWAWENGARNVARISEVGLLPWVPPCTKFACNEKLQARSSSREQNPSGCFSGTPILSAVTFGFVWECRRTSAKSPGWSFVSNYRHNYREYPAIFPTGRKKTHPWPCQPRQDLCRKGRQCQWACCWHSLENAAPSGPRRSSWTLRMVYPPSLANRLILDTLPFLFKVKWSCCKRMCDTKIKTDSDMVTASPSTSHADVSKRCVPSPRTFAPSQPPCLGIPWIYPHDSRTWPAEAIQWCFLLYSFTMFHPHLQQILL